MAMTKEQKDELAKKLHDAYISEFKEAYPDSVPEDVTDDSINEEFGIWLDGPHPEFPDWTHKELMDDEGGENEADDSYGYIQLKALPKLDELKALYESINSSEPEDKPHDTELAGDTTLEEELMLNQNMSPEEFSKLVAEKRGAKKGEPAPDMTPGNVLSDRTQKNIIQTLSAHRW